MTTTFFVAHEHSQDYERVCCKLFLHLMLNFLVMVFDVLYFHDTPLHQWPLFKRRELLEKIVIAEKGVIEVVAHSTVFTRNDIERALETAIESK